MGTGNGGRWLRVGLVAVALHAAVGAAPGLEGQAADPARSWFQDTYERRAVAVEPSELDRLAESWRLSTDPDRPLTERQEFFRDLLELMIEVQDVPDGRYTEQGLRTMAGRVASVEGLEAPPSPLPVRTAGWGEPGSVHVVGEGPLPLVLLSDVDYDGTIYDAFADLFADRFTMYVVTLPGAGGTKPPPLPDDGRPSETAWWDNAAHAVLSTIEEGELERPVIVGSASSAYLAARLALDHPDRFRAAVLLNGLVESFLFIPGTPGTPAPEQRRIWIDGTLPNLFPSPAPESTLQTYLAGSAASAIDSTRAEVLSRRAARTHPAVVSRYSTELMTTDLGDDLAELRVPTLVIPSVHDERSPVTSSPMATAQWQQLEIDHPEAPLTVVPFRATRTYPSVDSPLELGRAIQDLLAGRTVEGKSPDPALTAYRASARSAVTQVVGSTEIEIEYSSPAARGRAVWGGIVPWQAVWRAGANAATRIRFSRDVTVEGHPLEAGRYSFFVIPREDGPWTAVFNRIDIQWGAFAYDSAYDAARIDIPAQEAAHSERLRFGITPRGPVDGLIEMTWAGRSLELDVRAAEGTGMRRVVAKPFERLDRLSWTTLAVDSAGDARAPTAPDGTRLAYHHDVAGDTLWFRFDLQGRSVIPGLGLNVAVDTDLDQATGEPWWGGNSDFRYDRVVTVWVVPGIGSDFWGTVGISEPGAVARGDYAALGFDNVAFAVSDDGRSMVVGVPAGDLSPDGRMRLIGTVGTNMFWSDELVNQGSVRLDLGAVRRPSPSDDLTPR